MVDKYQLGGAEEVAISYKKCLISMGYSCDLIGINAGINSESNYLCKNYYYYFYLLIKKIIKYKGRIVLISHTTRSFLLGILCKILFPFKIKLLFVQHLNHKEEKVKLLARFSLFCSKYIQITPITNDIYKKHLSQKKVFYINNFILNKPRARANKIIDNVIKESKGRKIITFVGAMRKPGKNPAHIFKLANLLPENKFYFLIIGDGKGTEFEAFKQEMSDYSTKRDNYKWVGYQSDVVSFLKISNYLFFSSYNDYEMMPMTVLEGVAVNSVVFAYDLEINHHLLPKENIFQYEDFDSISMAIIGNKLSAQSHNFDIEYAKDKFRELIKTL